MKIIDTHCHVQMHQYDGDRREVIQRALEAGVGMICVGVDLESSRQAIELADEYEGLWASVGLHPNDNLREVYDQGLYEKLVYHPKVVAVGEIGLDYYRTTDPVQRAFQKKRFTEQLSLSDKPRIIHCRDAHTDMIELLKASRNIKGVIHSFTGTKEDALQYIELGFYIGLNGIITFAREYDEAIRAIPLDRIVLETDAPYLTPVPYRGKRNEPVYILEVAKMLATILPGYSAEQIMNLTLQNTKSLFCI